MGAVWTVAYSSEHFAGEMDVLADSDSLAKAAALAVLAATYAGVAEAEWTVSVRRRDESSAGAS